MSADLDKKLEQARAKLLSKTAKRPRRTAQAQSKSKKATRDKRAKKTPAKKTPVKKTPVKKTQRRQRAAEEAKGPKVIPGQPPADQNPAETPSACQVLSIIDGKPEVIGRSAGQVIGPELREEIQEYTLENPLKTQREIAELFNVGLGRVCTILQEAPALQEQLSQKRQELIKSNLELAVGLMTDKIIEGIQAGSIKLTSNNLSQYAVLLGVTTDKLLLLSGRATSRAELSVGTLEERKGKMIEVLDRAEGVLKRVN